MNDLRHAFRQLAKSPGFTAVALLTLALGIGVNTSMFTVLSTLLFHQPPYPEPDALMRVYRTGPTFQTGPHSPANIIDLRAQSRSFAHLAAFARTDYNLAEPGQPAERLPGMDVSGDFFAALGVQPALGRTLGDTDDQPGSAPVVVLSDATWRQRFNADPAILQRQIRLGGQPVTVVGVMPPGFDDPFLWGRVAAWRPLAFTAEQRAIRGSNWLQLFGRLRPGVAATEANAELATLAANLARAHPDTNANTGLNLVPLARSMQDATGRRLSWFTMGLAACVLLIACVNLANLLFARNAARSRELAIRTALGASRGRLVRLALTESVVLALLGGAVGLLVAVWCNALLSGRVSVFGQTGLALSLDPRVIGFSFAVALLSGLAFGLLPALLASRTDINEALKQGARGTTSATHRVRHALIVTEVALALVLLSGAGFFLRGLERMLDRDYGWRPENLLTATLSLPASKYPDNARSAAFFERLQPKLAAIPGVASAAISRTLPYSEFGFGQRFVVEGRPPPAPGTEPQRDLNAVSPEFFDTIGLALVAGRNFTAADLTGPMRTIVSESMAQRLWPGESALGKRIRHPSETEWQEIVGVARNITFATNLNRDSSVFQAYRLFRREPALNATLSLRSSLPASTLADAVRRAVADIDPEQPVQEIVTATEVIERRLANVTLASRTLLGFAVLGLVLAAVGIYGVISGFVVQRTNEIGIRLALGAQVRDILRLVLGRGLGLALLGCALGLAGAYGVARLLASMMPALPAPEPLTAAALTLLLLAIAAFACWLPARRAAKVDPMVALRAE